MMWNDAVSERGGAGPDTVDVEVPPPIMDGSSEHEALGDDCGEGQGGGGVGAVVSSCCCA